MSHSIPMCLSIPFNSLVLVFDYTVVNEIARSCSTPLLTKHGVWQRVLLLQTTRLDATPGTLETAAGCIVAALFCLRVFLLTHRMATACDTESRMSEQQSQNRFRKHTGISRQQDGMLSVIQGDLALYHAVCNCVLCLIRIAQLCQIMSFL